MSNISAKLTVSNVSYTISALEEEENNTTRTEWTKRRKGDAAPEARHWCKTYSITRLMRASSLVEAMTARANLVGDVLDETTSCSDGWNIC